MPRRASVGTRIDDLVSTIHAYENSDDENQAAHVARRRSEQVATIEPLSIVEYRPIEIAGGNLVEQHARQGGSGQVELACFAGELGAHRRGQVGNNRAMIARLSPAISRLKRRQ